MIKKLFLLTLVSSALSAQGAVILGWDFDTMLGAGGAANGTAGGTAATQALSTFNEVGVESSIFNIGSGGLGSQNALAGGYRTRGWGADTLGEAITDNEYFSFSVTADSGYTLDIDSITLFSYSLSSPVHELTLRSSLDGFTTNLASSVEAASTAAASEKTLILTGSEFDSVTSAEFRIYIHSTGTGNDFIHHSFGQLSLVDARYDVAVNGAAVIPEPSFFASLLGVVILGVMWFRRK